LCDVEAHTFTVDGFVLFQGSQGSIRAPWLSFAKSLPLYALAVAHFSFNWGYFTLMACLPQYFKYILHFDIKEVGFVCLRFVSCVFVLFVF